MYTVKVDVSAAQKILEKHGLQSGGPAQRFLSSELMRLSDPYVPFDRGALKNSAKIDTDGKGIIYDTPYARYHYYGKLMVDPTTGKGCFVFKDKKTGNIVKYSRPGVQKVLTNRDMIYHGAPLRGARWAERCWTDRKEDILNSLQKFIDGGCK